MAKPQVLVNKDLAKSLRAIGEEGAEVFYKGWMAEEMTTFSIYGPKWLKKGLEKMAEENKRSMGAQACFILEPVVERFLATQAEADEGVSDGTG